MNNIRELLNKLLLNNLGYSLEKDTGRIFTSFEEDANKGIELVKRNTMLSRQNLMSLFEFVEYINRYSIEGALVECGVWKGGAVGMMAYASKFFNNFRDLHLCDVFDDICEPDYKVDGERAVREAGGIENAQGRLKSIKGIYDAFGGHGTVNECRKLLEDVIGYEKERIYFHEGWFQDTLLIVQKEIDKIAILRLDSDYYASTKICLESLYDKVVLGGVIIIDDYETYDGCKKAVDEFIQKKKLQVFLNYINKESRYWFKN